MVAANVLAQAANSYPAAATPACPRARRASVAALASALRAVERRIARLTTEELDYAQDALWDRWDALLASLCETRAMSLRDLGEKDDFLAQAQRLRRHDEVDMLVTSIAGDVRLLVLAAADA